MSEANVGSFRRGLQIPEGLTSLFKAKAHVEKAPTVVQLPADYKAIAAEKARKREEDAVSIYNLGNPKDRQEITRTNFEDSTVSGWSAEGAKVISVDILTINPFTGGERLDCRTRLKR